MLIRSVIKGLQAVQQQGFNVVRIFQSGYSLSSQRIIHGVALHVGDLGTIIDVGANQGQFALAAISTFPMAQIISFEPLPDLYEKFKSNLSRAKRVRIHNLALGASSGVIDFYRNDYSHASSALAISEKQRNAMPETSRTTKIRVNIGRLDEILSESDIVGPVLLKLDVQGYERNVLEGATKLLPKIDYLVFEASFSHMYDGEPLFDEMHRFVSEAGFKVTAPVGYLEGPNGEILQMDFLYKRQFNFGH